MSRAQGQGKPADRSARSDTRAVSGDAVGVIRAGDHVLHAPSGETWVVAWADPARDDLAWLGWPDGIARLSDCTLVRAASDDEHQQTLRALKRFGGSRAAKALRLYGEPSPVCDTPTPHATSEPTR